MIKLVNLLVEVLSEEMKAGTFRGYHRTKIDEPTKFNTGFRPGYGAGAMYGPGIYMTYELEDQLDSEMKGYGSTIVEYEVKNNRKFLIFDKSEAAKVFGSSPTLIKQLKRVVGGDFNRFYKSNKADIDECNDDLESGRYRNTSVIAKRVSDIPDIENYVDGIVFTGDKDARVLAVFNTNIGNPIRYTKDDGKTWTSLKSKESYKIGRDERGSSKKLNYMKIAKRGSFEELNDKEKREFVLYTIGIEEMLTDPQFEWCDNELKKEYVKSIIAVSGTLTDLQFEWCDNDLKKEYVDKRIEDGLTIGDSEFEQSDEGTKRRYIKAIIKSANYMTDLQFEWCNNDLKKDYVERNIEENELISDKIFKWCDNDLKRKYLESVIKRDLVDYLEGGQKAWYEKNMKNK